MTLPDRPRVTPRSHRVRIAAHATSTHLYPTLRRRRRRWSMPFRVPSRASLRISFRSSRVRRGVPLRRLFTVLGHERVIGVSVAGIVLAASFLSVTPGRANGDTGGPQGDGSPPRLAVGGSTDGDDTGSVLEAYARPNDRVTDGDSTLTGQQPAGVAPAAFSIEGPFLDDGTLLKPMAVDTSVPDGSALMRKYRVKSGDTLATIAAHFDVSTMTVWWANDLKAKNRLVVGQELLIPPVSGLVVEVRPTDTLASLASTYKLNENEILATNGLKDRHLVVGQVLMLPGARGAGIAAPKPRSQPTTSSAPRRAGGPSTSVRPPRTYNGGRFLWPTTSHHISQYFHYGHYAIDIDGNTGDPIWAAASGTVIFAGWKNNGGGYQVWISHGSNLYTTYNHMSSVAVGRGQTVSRGQRVGRMGATGYATGSHLHFEVWKGPVWNGGVRVNPLAYL
jgi:murein DD-endopeptidase MepM/ murein hydrolase activator NlpD